MALGRLVLLFDDEIASVHEAMLENITAICARTRPFEKKLVFNIELLLGSKYVCIL